MSSKISFVDPSGKTLAESDLLRLPLKIGRAPENDLVLSHASISRYHCRVEDRGGSLWMIDQDSVNGIRVQGEKRKEILLQGAVDFKLGEIRVTYRGPVPVAVSNPVVASPSQEQTAVGVKVSEEATQSFQLKAFSPPTGGASGQETVIRRPAPVAGPLPSAPNIRRPGTGFEDSTVTNFKLKTEPPPATPTLPASPSMPGTLSDEPMVSSPQSFKMPDFSGFKFQLPELNYSQIRWALSLSALLLAGLWAWQERGQFTTQKATPSFWSRSDVPPKTLEEFLDEISLDFRNGPRPKNQDSISSANEP